MAAAAGAGTVKAAFTPEIYNESIKTCKGQIEAVMQLCLHVEQVVAQDTSTEHKLAVLDVTYKAFSNPREDTEANFINWGKYRAELFNVGKKFASSKVEEHSSAYFIIELLSLLNTMDHIFNTRASIPLDARLSGTSLAVVKRYHATFMSGVLKAVVALIKHHNVEYPYRASDLGTKILDKHMEDILTRIKSIDLVTYQNDAEARGVLIDLVGLIITLSEAHPELRKRLRSQYGIVEDLEAFKKVSIGLGSSINSAYEQLQNMFAKIADTAIAGAGAIADEEPKTMRSPRHSAVGVRRVDRDSKFAAILSAKVDNAKLQELYGLLFTFYLNELSELTKFYEDLAQSKAKDADYNSIGRELRNICKDLLDNRTARVIDSGLSEASLTVTFNFLKKHILALSKSKFVATDITHDINFIQKYLSSLMLLLMRIAPEVLSRKMFDEILFPVLKSLTSENNIFADCMLNFFEKALSSGLDTWISPWLQLEISFRLGELYRDFAKNRLVHGELLIKYSSIIATLDNNTNLDRLLTEMGNAAIDHAKRLEYIEVFISRYQSSPKDEALVNIASAAIAVFMGFIANETLDKAIRLKVLDALIILVEDNPTYFGMLDHIYKQIATLAGNDKRKNAFLSKIEISDEVTVEKNLAIVDQIHTAELTDSKPQLSEPQVNAIFALVKIMNKPECPEYLRLQAIQGLVRNIFTVDSLNTPLTELLNALNTLTEIFQNTDNPKLKESALENAAILIRQKKIRQENASHLIKTGLATLDNLKFNNSVDVKLAIKIITFFAICADHNTQVSYEMLIELELPTRLSRLLALPSETNLPMVVRGLIQDLNAVYSQCISALNPILGIKAGASLDYLLKIMVTKAHGMLIEEYTSACRKNGIEYPLQEKFLELRRSEALEKVFVLIRANTSTKQAFLDQNGIGILCRLLLSNLVPCVRENILKILNYLVIENPEIHSQLLQAGLATSVLLNVSQNENYTNVAVQAKTLINNRVNYFTGRIIVFNLDQEINQQRIQRINLLLDLCKEDADEALFFAHSDEAVSLLIGCAFNPVDHASVRAAALITLFYFTKVNPHHLEMLSTLVGQLRDLVAGASGELRDAAMQFLYFLDDKTFTQVHELNLMVSKHFSQVSVAENISKIPQLVDIVADEKADASLKILALESLEIFAMIIENQAQMKPLIPMLNKLRENKIFSAAAKKLLKILEPIKIPVNNSKDQIEVPLEDKVSIAPTGEEGSIEREIFYLVDSLKAAIANTDNREAAYIDGIRIVNYLQNIINESSDNYTIMKEQGVSAELTKFRAQFEAEIEDDGVAISIIMLQGQIESQNSLSAKADPKIASATDNQQVSILFGRTFMEAMCMAYEALPAHN